MNQGRRFVLVPVLLVFAAAIGWAATAFARQAAAQQPNVPPATATILGQIVDADSGRPIPNATAILFAPAGAANVPVPPVASAAAGGPAQPRRSMTSDSGKFVFGGVAAGSYTLTATAPGYQAGAAGQGRAGGPSGALDVDDKPNTVVATTLKLWKYATISGVVSDENGEPAVGVQVRGLRRTMVAGKMQLTGFSSAKTDDRGMYRMSQLPPGDYVVVVPCTVTSVPTTTVDAYSQALGTPASPAFFAQLSQAGAPLPSLTGIRLGDQTMSVPGHRGEFAAVANVSGPIFSYVTVYHPSATTSAQASVITLKSGEERAADLQLKLVRTVRLSGTLTGPAGPAANIGVRLLPQDADQLQSDNGFEAALSVTDTAGRFTFPAVASGTYVFRAQRVSRQLLTSQVGIPGPDGTIVLSATPSPGVFSEPTVWVQTSITVGDTDQTDMVVTLHPGVQLTGRVVFEGTAAPPPPQRFGQLAITMRASDGGDSGLPMPPTRPTSDGRFQSAQVVPNRYLISAMGAPAPWRLKSITAAGRDVSLQPLDVSASDIADIVVTFTDQVTKVTGSVKDRSAAVSDAVIVVFPSDYEKYVANGLPARQAMTAVSGKNGTFTTGTLPAGDYVAVAIPGDLDVDLGNPKWLAKLASGGSKFSIALGETKQLNLTLSRIQ